MIEGELITFSDGNILRNRGGLVLHAADTRSNPPMSDYIKPARFHEANTGCVPSIRFFHIKLAHFHTHIHTHVVCVFDLMLQMCFVDAW